MPEQLLKLSPDRDLQCYFLTPSAIAAMSGASPSGFVLSGKWRQQFDWAVVEWNRDNVFEHPSLRPLPDGDLSGLLLSYEETRSGCTPLESDVYPVVAWPDLRLWTEDDHGVETVTQVKLWPNHATPVLGTYAPASGSMTLVASPGAGNRVGLALLESHFYYTVQAGDSLAQIAAGVAGDIQQLSQDFNATSNGATVTVTWKAGPNWAGLLGANGNRVSMYGFSQGGAVCWQAPAATFHGGQFPQTYKISIDFGSLVDANGNQIAKRVRKMRWTWAADLQPAEFQQTEFQVQISNWTVSGANRAYLLAGPGSRRIDDTDASVGYTGEWGVEMGNYSGSRIHHTTAANASCTCEYSETAPHDLYVGTRLLGSGANLAVSVDGTLLAPISTGLNGEDVLVRRKIASLPEGSHRVTLTNVSANPADFYLDFFEIVYPSAELPSVQPQTQLALATDWDTYHSQSLPAERTAWLIHKLGFAGRVNHYAGALWFYEIYRPGTVYASAALTFSTVAGSVSPSVTLNLAAPSQPGEATPALTAITHLILPDDTAQTIAQALAALINVGSNLVWASATDSGLTLMARAMGRAGDGIAATLDPISSGVSMSPATAVSSGGIDAIPYDLPATTGLNQTLIAAADGWRTDLQAQPRLNRAARDWHQAYFTALRGYGLDCVCSFSTELKNGDPSAETGIAQCYPDGTAVVLNTPAIQTNFSPASLAFWKQVYLDMAGLQASAGLRPYLQFGEVQWWYFPNSSGMPFYDAWTQQAFQSAFGVPMQTIISNSADPSLYPRECTFLPLQIGNYTAAIRSALQASFPECWCEVLYPTDVNHTPLNQVINYAAADWTPQNLACLKTESFTFTGSYNLDLSAYSIGVSGAKGFPNSSRSHLIGISDSASSWIKESNIAQANGLESIVLFALDQFCLIGYAPPPFRAARRTQRQG